MENSLRWQKVTFWLRQQEGEMLWCFGAEGVIGPDDALHVVLDPPEFLELADFVNDLAEGIKEMRVNDEPPQGEDQEGGSE